ncbi:uncharacterized protein C8A04DRAFT_27161 [Dichotomopilus funicola]|uniref:Uncharacterized protein n=1 Tax=Dichotomopilus funicola TaxID=1934379 RepID=A0AAN6V7U3_9PEZI|nr:hypothetical protein C8A04DRAFT_27161 [Dichotomopilus funicola]
MSSPISIGDAYLMARLAFKLGRAFTKGRKSAPDEFREVENQLYSLSAALSALSEEQTSASAALNIDTSRLPSVTRGLQVNNGGDVLMVMLSSCQETLKHLEHLVEKYSSIREPRDPAASTRQRWRRELRDIWRTIEWTTEGGDLATLRSQLTVHTNSLSLILAVVNHTKAGRIQEDMTQASKMLREIHTWFVENLRDPPNRDHDAAPPEPHDQDEGPRDHHAAPPGPHDQDEGATPVIQLPFTEVRFRLGIHASTEARNFVCPQASLHPEWTHKASRGVGGHSGQPSTPKQVFRCRCTNTDQPGSDHRDLVGEFGLSPLSFAIRLAGKEKAWMLYKAVDRSTNKLVSLLISGVPAARIAEFEDRFVDTLRARTAKSLLDQNLGTMLAYQTPSTPGGPSETRVLDLMADLQGIENLVDSVTLTMNKQSYTRNSVETIQLLHYETLKQDDLTSQIVQVPADNSPEASAELVVFYGSDPDAAAIFPSQDVDVDRMIVKIVPTTTIRADDRNFKVLLKDVECVGHTGTEETVVLGGVDVAFQLASPENAREFSSKLEAMRMELIVMSLRAPLPNEKLLLSLHARGAHTEDLNMAESEIKIFQSTTTQRLRLIVQSKDGCTLISQQLAENFLPVSNDGQPCRPNFRSPSYVVQVVGAGTREVHHYPDGFRILQFDDVQMDRLVGLGLAAVSGSSASIA